MGACRKQRVEPKDLGLGVTHDVAEGSRAVLDGH
jgi:hypothetical protein